MTRLPVCALFLAAASLPLAAQPPAPFDPYRANIDSGLRLHADPAIQAELKLTDEQKAKIAKIPDELLARHKDAIEKEKAASKEADEKLNSLQVEIQKKLDALIEKHLTADQRKRLDQLTAQAMRVGAFNDEAVAKALSLPADYRTKLGEIQRANSEKLRKDFPDYFPPTADFETRRKYAEAQRKMVQDTLDQFVETFTDEQKKAWKELVGPPSEAANPTGRVGGLGLGVGFPIGNPRFMSRAALLTSEPVLTELKLEKAASDALTAGIRELQTASRTGGLGGPGGFRGFNSVQATIGSDAAKLADEILTAPQTKRLEQVRFQLAGTNVFSTIGTTFVTGVGSTITRATTNLNPLAKLTLTPAQVVKIDAVLADATAQRQKLGGRGGLPIGFGGFRAAGTETEAQKKARLEYQQKLREIDQKALADIQATFDAGQKAAWKELAGDPIDLSKVSTTDLPFGSFAFPSFNPTGRRATIINLWMTEASRRSLSGEYAAALAAFDEAIRLAPADTLYRLSKARLLATCPSEWVRDGKQAVELIHKVMEQTKEPTAAQYDVLAAALAETGQFGEAVTAQERAIALLPKGDPNDATIPPSARTTTLKPQYEARLKLYQEKKPYRIEPGRTGREPLGAGGPTGAATPTTRTAATRTSRPIRNWGQLTDPDGDSTVRTVTREGKLTITVPATLHDLNPRNGTINAPRVLREVEGDFAVQVKVSGAFKPGTTTTAPRSKPFNGAGLLVWADEKNYARLERNAWVNPDGGTGCYTPLFEVFKGGEYQQTNPPFRGADFFQGTATWLKLERKGDTLTASYSHDGKEWSTAKEVAVGLPKKVQVGVSAINTSDKPLAVEFSEFKVTGGP